MTQPDTTPKKSPALPIRFVLLDIAGALLAAVGLYELFAGGPPLMPPGLMFPGYPVAFLVIGALMMMPLVRHILNRNGHK
jgi:hypothetical protein